MYCDVVSSVPVLFERPANWLSGYMDQEGGALSHQTQVSDQRGESGPFSSKQHLGRFVFLRAGSTATSISILTFRNSFTFRGEMGLMFNVLKNVRKKILLRKSLCS
ncbi:hypothetical protein ILYODFUR_002959 [Ilyodon furcidens]|uniref:Uncharacterized protein n=1 Tax=Ilyodon furcidens TaxID=33524 RepID=A0ABV0U659_9TELE